jgi:DNA-binding GntR family transcriptional regulator
LTARLRSERDLAEHYEVSYGTIRRAMEVLRERGLIATIHGRGTFVTDLTAAKRRFKLTHCPGHSILAGSFRFFTASCAAIPAPGC